MLSPRTARLGRDFAQARRTTTASLAQGRHVGTRAEGSAIRLDCDRDAVLLRIRQMGRSGLSHGPQKLFYRERGGDGQWTDLL